MATVLELIMGNEEEQNMTTCNCNPDNKPAWNIRYEDERGEYHDGGVGYGNTAAEAIRDAINAGGDGEEDETAYSATPEHGTLYDYQSGEEIRAATSQELNDSREQAESDGGAGVIDVDGRSCYVVEG